MKEGWKHLLRRLRSPERARQAAKLMMPASSANVAIRDVGIVQLIGSPVKPLALMKNAEGENPLPIDHTMTHTNLSHWVARGKRLAGSQADQTVMCFAVRCEAILSFPVLWVAIWVSFMLNMNVGSCVCDFVTRLCSYMLIWDDPDVLTEAYSSSFHTTVSYH